jgi:signal transduction histidine kinase
VAFESNYSSGEGGVGLGLTICREIAEAHGWTISITDGEDGGARIELTGVETRTEERT